MKFEEILPALRKGKVIKDNAGICYQYTKKDGFRRYDPKGQRWYNSWIDCESICESSLWDILPDEQAETILPKAKGDNLCQ